MVSRAVLGLVIACAVSAVACGDGSSADTAVDLRLITPEDLDVKAGGYQISVRRANGSPIDTLDDVFVPFVGGEQIVRLAVDDLKKLGETARVATRIAVRAVIAEGGTPFAFGSAEATFESDEVRSASVRLYRAPQATGDQLRAWPVSTETGFIAGPDALRFRSRQSAAFEEWHPDTVTLHAWLSEDNSVSWLGIIPKTGLATLQAPAGFVGPLFDGNLTLFVSAESADLTSEIVSPMGPWIFEGQVDATAEEILGPRYEALFTLARVFELGSTHAQLAVAAPTNAANVSDHTEHVANIFSDGAPYDFDGTSGNEDPASSFDGPEVLLAAAVDGLGTALENDSASFAVPVTHAAALSVCAGADASSGLLGLMADVVTAAESFSTTPGDPGADALLAAVDAVLGNDGESDSGFLCVRSLLEEAGSFFLHPQL